MSSSTGHTSDIVMPTVKTPSRKTMPVVYKKFPNPHLNQGCFLIKRVKYFQQYKVSDPQNCPWHSSILLDGTSPILPLQGKQT